MKKPFFALILLSTLLLSGCDLFKQTTNSSSNGGTSSGGNISSGSNSTGGQTEEKVKIEIYSSNDIHGQIKESYPVPGLGKYATYFKQRREEANTLLFDQGDAWQGSIYSNLNHGALVTDVMNYVHYDARCIGNHDFDWGLDYIKSNNARSYNGYTVPALAGNIYDFNFDTKQEGSVQQSDIGAKSTILTVNGDIKVGILGGIGMDQIKDISSLYVKDITFKNHVDFIKEEAAHLRNDENCNIVICLIHSGQDSVMGNDLKDYVDLVLCGHTHQRESANEGNLYYVQSGGYEDSFAHVTLTYDYKAGDVVNTKVQYLTGTNILNKVESVDPAIQSIIDTYNCDTEANTVMANNVNGYFDRYEQSSNLVAKAILDTAIAEGYNDVIFSMVNVARQALPNSTTWTFADIYQSFPFDNTVYIAEVRGSEIQYQIGYDYIARNPNYTNNTIDMHATYKIAVLDFVYWHCGVDRYYDYFPITGGTSSTTLSTHYRNILRNWLLSNHYNEGTLLDSSNFSFSQWAYNKDAFMFV